MKTDSRNSLSLMELHGVNTSPKTMRVQSYPRTVDCLNMEVIYKNVILKQSCKRKPL